MREYPLNMSVGERCVSARSRVGEYGDWRIGLVLALAVLAGCQGRASPSMPRLGPEDFAARARSTPPALVQGSASIATPASGRRPLNASAFVVPDSSVLVPPAVEPAEMSQAAGPELVAAPVVASAVLFDIKVGEVNNKPIFAAEFLEPIAQRLRAMAYEDVPLPGGGTTARLIPRDQWRYQANQVIFEQLKSFVDNELVIAEGLASYTPAQRTGLRNFIGLARDRLERGAGGSITRAVRELGTGQTLSEYLQDVRNRELIQKFYEDMRRSIVVTRSDVQRAYLRKYGDSQRESTLTFRRIRVPKRNAEGVARVSSRLASGEPFAEVAADDANTSRRSAAGLWPPMTFEGNFAEATFFPTAPDIDQSLRELTPGEWAGPIEDERNVHWIYLEAIEIGFKTWAEAQSELREELLQQRWEEANFRAMTRLYEQAGMTDVQEMRAELLEVATAWFYPES